MQCTWNRLVSKTKCGSTSAIISIVAIKLNVFNCRARLCAVERLTPFCGFILHCSNYCRISFEKGSDCLVVRDAWCSKQCTIFNFNFRNLDVIYCICTNTCSTEPAALPLWQFIGDGPLHTKNNRTHVCSQPLVCWARQDLSSANSVTSKRVF